MSRIPKFSDIFFSGKFHSINLLIQFWLLEIPVPIPIVNHNYNKIIDNLSFCKIETLMHTVQLHFPINAEMRTVHDNQSDLRIP